MATHDLLSEDDFFSQSESTKEKKKEEPLADTDEAQLFDDMKDDIHKSIDDMPLEDEDAGDDIIINEEDDAFLPEEDAEETVLDEEEPAEDERELAAESQPLLTEYEDEKQEGLNYKPFYIGGAIILFLVLLFFAYQFFFSGDNSAEPPKAETSAEKAIEPVRSQKEIRRENYMATLAGQTGRQLSLVSNAVGSTNKSTKLSSVLIYGSDFFIQVFSDNRENLAKYNIQLREKLSPKKLGLISSTVRPGSNGGIFGLFDIGKENDAPGSAKRKVINSIGGSDEAKRWLTELAKNDGVKIKDIKINQDNPVPDFAVYRMEALFNGSLESCNKLLDSISQAGKNISIHKLNFMAGDQKKFSSGKYQLKMILKIYV